MSLELETQHDDTQLKDIQYNKTQHINVQHYETQLGKIQHDSQPDMTLRQYLQ
jgi:hypothetical protein